jgi:hypothetical protein
MLLDGVVIWGGFVKKKKNERDFFSAAKLSLSFKKPKRLV